MSYSISTLLTRNLHEVFGENDPARRRAVETVSIPVRATMFSLTHKHFDHTLLTPCAYFSGFSVSHTGVKPVTLKKKRPNKMRHCPVARNR